MKQTIIKGTAIALLFAIVFLALSFAGMQYRWPGKWGGDGASREIKGAALTLAQGSGGNIQGRLKIEDAGRLGVAIATIAPAPFPARDYPVVRWSISGAVPGSALEFVWRTREHPEKAFSRKLVWIDDSLPPLRLQDDSNWRGQITEVTLMVHAPMHAPMVIELVRFEAQSPPDIIRDEWFGKGPWLGTSINFVGGNELRQWIAPLPMVAAALGLTLLGYGLLVWRKVIVHDARLVWALIFLAWLLLDLRWQLDLSHKLDLTQQRYAGKSWEGKHLAADDGRLFDLMRQFRAKIPQDTARVFLFAETEYIVSRSAYHLYPLNVLRGRNLLPARQYKPGDFIIVLGKDEVEYDGAERVLKWGKGLRLSAELLVLAENNVLLKVR